MNYYIDPISFAESICSHPKLWTATGRIEEVMALFHGYEVAICHSRTSPVSQPAPSDALEWFAQKSGEQWRSQQAKKLREIYGSDEATFNELLKYLKQMRLEHDASNK